MALLALLLSMCLPAWAKPCAKCQQENPDASLFCQTCGQRFLPARTCLKKPDPWPQAEDPSLKPWRQEPRVPDVGPALAAWRGTYEADND